MGSVNKVILVGNLGRDAELRYTPGGAPVATLNLATTEVWNDKGGQKQEKTEWHRVVLWGKSAESLNEYLVKGKQIYVEGRLQTRQWDDKDGEQALHDRDPRRPGRPARRRGRRRRDARSGGGGPAPLSGRSWAAGSELTTTIFRSGVGESGSQWNLGPGTGRGIPIGCREWNSRLQNSELQTSAS